MTVKFWLTLMAEGNFPGSPEKDTIEIDQDDHDMLWEKYILPRAVAEGWANKDIVGMKARLYRAELSAAKQLIVNNHELDADDLANKLIINYAKEHYTECFSEVVATNMREMSMLQSDGNI